ncbi:hypothetical protein MICRO116_10008 [Micrococcus sp. 116]|nr:hypothetical protein MICRO116_10008 [Micrococcus sp. 116]
MSHYLRKRVLNVLNITIRGSE